MQGSTGFKLFGLEGPPKPENLKMRTPLQSGYWGGPGFVIGNSIFLSLSFGLNTKKLRREAGALY